MQNILVLTAIDVRRASETGSGRPNLVTKLTIPPIKFATANHNPGGGVISKDYVLPRVQTIEPAFSVKGIDTDIFRGFGTVDRWVFAGAYRDTKTGAMLPARAIIEGAIAEWEPDETSPEEFQGCNHMFKEVGHFELRLNGKELWYIDDDERALRRNGDDLFKDVRQALGG